VGSPTNVSGPLGLIYIQIRLDQSKAKAQQIQQKLKEQQFDVPGIEMLDVGPTTNTEVRYFRKSEENGANDIVRILQSLDVQNVSAKYISGYGNSTKVKSKQYEIWFAANVFK
jgi:hypothetical protein